MLSITQTIILEPKHTRHSRGYTPHYQLQRSSYQVCYLKFITLIILVEFVYGDGCRLWSGCHLAVQLVIGIASINISLKQFGRHLLFNEFIYLISVNWLSGHLHYLHNFILLILVYFIKFPTFFENFGNALVACVDEIVVAVHLVEVHWLVFWFFNPSVCHFWS